MKFKVGTIEYDFEDSKIKDALEKGPDQVIQLIENVTVRTQEEEDKFVANMKKDARREGIEIAVKKYREEKGLSFEGKNIESLISAVTEKVLADAKLSPDEAIKKINEKLKSKEEALEIMTKRAEKAENDLSSTKSEYKINSFIDKYLPENLALPADDIKLILKSKLKFEEDEEGNIITTDLVNNKQLKSTNTGDFLPMKDAIEDFFRTNTHYVSKNGGGRGKGDSDLTENGKMSLEKFNENMKEKGFSINSPEYTVELNKAIEDKTVEID